MVTFQIHAVTVNETATLKGPRFENVNITKGKSCNSSGNLSMPGTHYSSKPTSNCTTPMLTFTLPKREIISDLRVLPPQKCILDLSKDGREQERS
jgi:hypothetical protein